LHDHREIFLWWQAPVDLWSKPAFPALPGKAGEAQRSLAIVHKSTGARPAAFYKTPAADPAIRVKDKSVSESFGNE
jgi:hypothetical protein